MTNYEVNLITILNESAKRHAHGIPRQSLKSRYYTSGRLSSIEYISNVLCRFLSNTHVQIKRCYIFGWFTFQLVNIYVIRKLKQLNGNTKILDGLWLTPPTPGHVPFRTCICSIVETIFS